VRSRASEDFQFVVISLKNTFWERARGLVGIWRDVDAGSSKVLTLDVGDIPSFSVFRLAPLTPYADLTA
jgi:chromosome segregation ATPase